MYGWGVQPLRWLSVLVGKGEGKHLYAQDKKQKKKKKKILSSEIEDQSLSSEERPKQGTHNGTQTPWSALCQKKLNKEKSSKSNSVLRVNCI